MVENIEDVVFTCPRCGCHKLQEKDLVPVYNTVTEITRRECRKIFPLNRHDEFTYDYDTDHNNDYDYDRTMDDGVECAECGMSWKDLRSVALAGCLQKPCPALDHDETNNEISFTKDRHMKAECILGVNRDGRLVVLTHLIHNFSTLHSARVAVMKPLNAIDVKNARAHGEPETCRQLWKDAVAEGETEESLEEFTRGLVKDTRQKDSATLYVGDDAYLRRETMDLLTSLPDGTRKLLLQAMQAADPCTPNTPEEWKPSENGNLPVLAFLCEWTGNLEPEWMKEMTVLTAEADEVEIVNAYVGDKLMPDTRDRELREMWAALGAPRRPAGKNTTN